jgi:hypothetical protein
MKIFRGGGVRCKETDEKQRCFMNEAGRRVLTAVEKVVKLKMLKMHLATRACKQIRQYHIGGWLFKMVEGPTNQSSRCSVVAAGGGF